MKHRRIGLAIAATVQIGLLSACSPDSSTKTAAVSTAGETSAADNSAKNARDRGGDTLTPGDQGSSNADLNVTQAVRKSVVDHDGFSVNAKNVKIITQDGVVTLRGPVANAAEKAQIEIVTARASGVKRVVNELEVESN